MPETTSIHDPLDPRIAPYRDVRERDLVGREGRFIAEGKVVLRVLFTARRFAPESALILDRRLAGMSDVLAAAPEDMPVFTAGQAVMDEVAGFHVHRGILALGRVGAPQDMSSLLDALPQRALVVVLAGISNHDNMGSVFRNAAAFGADAVLLDPSCCDPLYRKSIRVSVGAALKVPFARAGSAQALADLLAARGFVNHALSPSAANDVAALGKLAPRNALWLGSEGEGLPPALMGSMNGLRIDIAGDFDSLNVAAASAVALHAFRSRAG